MIITAFVILFPAISFAQQTASSSDAISYRDGMLGLAAALAIGIAAAGGAVGQGKVAASAMEGIARNPEATGKVQTLLIVSLALIESLVIYALVIALLLHGKI